ncbi:hypothetical protein COI41_07800 [Bacillus toyonensis]|nr:hypothetical protein CN567_09660 [Bacillus toyonensis]PFX79872.1 hypothetical protein COL38_18450 [Bacillus toyonensis]PFX96537.1 hypothetical protein COL37_04530 [Bacillus toyonensis]PGB05110.1 hypothetical protein COL98_27980 [Bacillus toyonensis]PHF56630.1 hypothetical protein COI41_07800 [Bacillus toyonensis]
MKFHVIDRENWNREQYVEHYLKLKCSFSMTANVDITMMLEKIHQKEIKFYPALTGSKTPTSKFSGSKEVRWGAGCP